MTDIRKAVSAFIAAQEADDAAQDAWHRARLGIDKCAPARVAELEQEATARSVVRLGAYLELKEAHKAGAPSLPRWKPGDSPEEAMKIGLVFGALIGLAAAWIISGIVEMARRFS